MFLEQLSKLFDIKSIISLVITAVFAYLSIMRVIPVEQVMIVVTLVMTSLFSYTQGKRAGQEEEKIRTLNSKGDK